MMPAVRYAKTQISTILAEFTLQNGNNSGFPLIFVTSRQNDDEDTLRSQQHQISELGAV
jgi:hypothetical protein